MRHRRSGLKLNRSSSHRQAMFRNMVTSLLKYDKIKTTDAKAKEIRRWADHLITLAKKGDLHARRQALSIVREKKIVHELFSQVEERFGDRSGGYTRIVKLGFRPGDAASMSLIELVAEKPMKKEKKKDDQKKAEAAASEAVAEATSESADEVKEQPEEKTE